MQLSQEMPFFKQGYWTSQTWRRIDAAWLEGARNSAAHLETRARSLSVVLAIELEGGDVLLFSDSAAEQAVVDRDLLQRAIFRSDSVRESDTPVEVSF
jgi:hypothetical protein